MRDNVNEPKNLDGTRRCSKCGERKPLDDFHLHVVVRKNYPTWRGRRPECKACFAVAAAARFKLRKEAWDPARKRWYANNLDASDFSRARSRAKRCGATEFMSRAEWTAMRSTTVCHWCNCSLHPSFTTVDHIIPLVEGGQHTFANVVQTCWNCNLKRDWIRKTKYQRKET